MKTRRYLTKTIFAGLLVALLLVAGCGPFLVTRDGEKFSGVTETRQFDYTDFTRVEISTAFDYEIIRADTYSISVTAYTEAFEQLQVVRQGQTLKIGLRSGSFVWTVWGLPLKAVITMPQLDSLAGSGATDGVVANFSSTEDLEITLSGASSVELEGITAGDVTLAVSGASDVRGDLTAGNTKFELSDASSVRLDGSAQDAVIIGSGASHLKLADFRTNNADVALSGATDADVFAAGTLDAEISSASHLSYRGQPSLGRMNVSGGSMIEQD